jgi:hypothetical protein
MDVVTMPPVPKLELMVGTPPPPPPQESRFKLTINATIGNQDNNILFIIGSSPSTPAIFYNSTNL